MNGKICLETGGTNVVGKAIVQALAHRQRIQSICDHFPAALPVMSELMSAA
jgi:hypothetical protein